MPLCNSQSDLMRVCECMRMCVFPHRDNVRGVSFRIVIKVKVLVNYVINIEINPPSVKKTVEIFPERLANRVNK